MDAKTFFNYGAYFDHLTLTNKLSVSEKFKPCRCSGVGFLEGMLNSFRTSNAFVCSSDVTDDSLTQNGGAWFKRRVVTVFILHRYKAGNMTDCEVKMSICRELFRQFMSKLLVDEESLNNNMIYIHLDNIRSRELGGLFLNNCTGLYFMMNIDEPTELCFNMEDWNE